MQWEQNFKNLKQYSFVKDYGTKLFEPFLPASKKLWF